MKWKLYVFSIVAVLSISYCSAQNIEKVKFLEEDDITQILLIRHGEPDLKKDGWVGRKGAKKFFKDYDSVQIVIPTELPVTVIAGEVDRIYTSPLPRAYHTAQVLFGDSIEYVRMDLFREFERRVFKFISLRFPLKLWTTVSRALWLAGINNSGIESFKSARLRAKEGAAFLETKARDEGKVILVAHGFLNRYLMKYLKDSGWEVRIDGGSDYLATSLLVKAK